MNDREYAYLKKKIMELLKIDIDSYKGQQMRRRLESFVSRQKTDNPYRFSKMLEHDEGALKALKNMLTINVSEFFRDEPQFDHLRSTVLPELLEKRSHLNIWTAGCSNGQEPYSVAMILDDLAPRGSHRILATDIDVEVLKRAESGGPYHPKEVINLTKLQLQKHFTKTEEGYIIVDELRRRVQFREHNLLSDPYQEGYDLVLCRNVMIYFADEAKAKIFERFSQSLKPGGILFLGGTEALLAAENTGFERLAMTFYRKKDAVLGQLVHKKAA